jgi:hypothetical protein
MNKEIEEENNIINDNENEDNSPVLNKTIS